MPRLYQKYIGHDDNRDFYMMNMSESVNANRMMYREWFPAIMYNHHQTGPAGAVLFAPPFRDPFNYNFDPLVVLGIDMVGSAIHTRLAAEGKPGAVMRTGAPYSTWFNGGIRTTVVLPQPDRHPDRDDRQPDAGRDSVRARHAAAARRRAESDRAADVALPPVDRVLGDEQLRDPRHRVEAARKTSSSTCTRWRRTPSTRATATTGRFIPSASRRRVRRSKRRRAMPSAENIGPRAALGGAAAADAAPVRRSPSTTSVLHDPKMRDPRGYILPSDQPDFLTATKFVNILIKAGVIVHRATAAVYRRRASSIRPARTSSKRRSRSART